MQETIIYFYRKNKKLSGFLSLFRRCSLWTLIASTIYSICHANQKTTPELVTHTLHTRRLSKHLSLSILTKLRLLYKLKILTTKTRSAGKERRRPDFNSVGLYQNSSFISLFKVSTLLANKFMG